jgi:hypothetical protein
MANAEKLDKAAESGLDKVKKEYDVVNKKLSDLAAREKKEKEKRNKSIWKFLKQLIPTIIKILTKKRG